MGQYSFTDPKTGNIYVWERNPNPDGESPFGRTIPIARTPTTNGGFQVWQQGDPGPMVRQMKGRILTLHQFVEFWAWFKLSLHQTIWLHDGLSGKYEGQITSFQPQLVGVARNPRDPAGAPNNVWDYTMDFTVMAALEGYEVFAWGGSDLMAQLMRPGA